MLQQTQAGRVIPAYLRFLASYPDPASFAAASSADVISSWADLGYLHRATNLHRTAAIVAEDGWPDDLTRLPGVGPYTAAAVSVFAFGQRRAAVDVNLRRILSRWTGTTLTARAATESGHCHVDPDRPDDWNQAMMDLGATTCRPADPACDTCPVEKWCADPTIRITARPQGRFDGSRRQARAALLKYLTRGPAERTGLASRLGLVDVVVDDAVRSLVDEGLVRTEEGVVSLV